MGERQHTIVSMAEMPPENNGCYKITCACGATTEDLYFYDPVFQVAQWLVDHEGRTDQ